MTGAESGPVLALSRAHHVIPKLPLSADSGHLSRRRFAFLTRPLADLRLTTATRAGPVLPHRVPRVKDRQALGRGGPLDMALPNRR